MVLINEPSPRFDTVARCDPSNSDLFTAVARCNPAVTRFRWEVMRSHTQLIIIIFLMTNVSISAVVLYPYSFTNEGRKN